ncbi:MAG: phosphatidate cytidylyltransferase [Bacteroidales bacterium]|nr:phosphatidate cytidylyltransferase [Bacteroidales bacterium]
MKNFITRVISGAVYVGLIFCAIYFFDTIPAIFLAFFGLVTLIGLSEISRMTGDEQPKVVKYIDMAGALAVFSAFYIDEALDHSPLALLPVVAYALVRMSAQLYITSQNPIKSLQHSLFNVCYIAVPLGLMSKICITEHPMMLLSIFIFLWFNDSGAYLVGSAIGKRRLFERISPKKSWEGFWGGLTLAVAAGAVMGAYFNEFFHGPSPLLFAGLGLVVSVTATLGDLTESIIKRTAGVKDSSNLIPGHGGILDRIDSLLFAAPAALIYLVVIKNLF